MADEFDFDSLETQEIPVKYRGATFYLLEPDAETGRQFKNRIMEYQANDNKGVADVQPWLVSRCLYRTKPEGGQPGELVPLPVILTWGHKVVEPLFSKAVEIGELIPPQTVEAMERQVVELQKKITSLRKQEEARKNGSAATGTPSV